jgi:hypothetical protein
MKGPPSRTLGIRTEFGDGLCSTGQRDRIVERFAVASAHPSLRDAILPGRMDARPLRPGNNHLAVILEESQPALAGDTAAPPAEDDSDSGR